MDRSTIIILIAVATAGLMVSLIYAVDATIREHRRAAEQRRQRDLQEIERSRRLAERRRMGKLRRTAPACLRSLGLDERASPEEVLAAFRRLAFELHPDRGGDSDEFKRLHNNFEQAMEYAESRLADKSTKPR